MTINCIIHNAKLCHAKIPSTYNMLNKNVCVESFVTIIRYKTRILESAAAGRVNRKRIEEDL